MRLILVRHAEAHDADGVTIRTDAERPLTEWGRTQAAILGDFLAKVLPEKALLAASPLVRAQQTAQGLRARCLDLLDPEECWPELGIPADFEGIRTRLRETALETAILVGHMDDIAGLAQKLIGAQEGATPFRKGAAALFQWRGHLRWETATLKWWVDPDLLRAFAPG